jgi:hypothetical protein
MESEFTHRRFCICVTLGVVISLAIFAVAHRRPWESPATRAHRLCSECGLGVDEIDLLVDTMRHSTLTKEQNLELFYATFDDRSQANLCESCAEAVLDAARD